MCLTPSRRVLGSSSTVVIPDQDALTPTCPLWTWMQAFAKWLPSNWSQYIDIQFLLYSIWSFNSVLSINVYSKDHTIFLGFVYINNNLCTHIYTYMCKYKCLYVYTVCASTHIYIYMYKYIYKYVYTYINIKQNVYIYIYI